MIDDDTSSPRTLTQQQLQVEQAIQQVCAANVGVLNTSFLCRSVSVLNPRDPLCVQESATVEFVASELRGHKVGCVVVVSDSKTVSGIFSERDLVLKVLEDYEQNRRLPIKNFMTADPITQSPDATLAFVLNLMSVGGFRHLPLVDSENHPVGIVSVKDVVDYIVESYMNDLMNFQTS